MFKSKNKAENITSYSLEGIDKGHHKVQYRGINCIKCPFDYVMYQMIVTSIKPDLIIEIGTNEGGSALYLADLLALNVKGEIHTIDIEDRVDERAKENKRIQFFFDGWAAYDTTQINNYKTVLVIEDASHHYKDTLDAITRFAPFVTKGSYLIVEDGIIDALGVSAEYGGGPVKAINEFLPAHPEFIVDNTWCDFFGKSATFNTKGYLKRIS